MSRFRNKACELRAAKKRGDHTRVHEINHNRWEEANQKTDFSGWAAAGAPLSNPHANQNKNALTQFQVDPASQCSLPQVRLCARSAVALAPAAVPSLALLAPALVPAVVARAGRCCRARTPCRATVQLDNDSSNGATALAQRPVVGT